MHTIGELCRFYQSVRRHVDLWIAVCVVALIALEDFQSTLALSLSVVYDFAK